MNYVPLIPQTEPLIDRVEVIFSLDGYAPEHKAERLVPNGRMTLVIELDDRDRFIFDNQTGEPIQTCRRAWLSGVHRRYLTIGETSTTSRLAAVQFAPGRALPLIHQPLEPFNDRVVPAADVFGTDLLELREQLLQTPPGESTVRTIAVWLEQRYDRDLEPSADLTGVVSQLLEAPGQVVITEAVAALESISYKRFLAEFRKHVGPSPKTMQRILRFAQIFGQLQERQSVNWADLAVELGYADQAHLARDFSEFSGYRPASFLRAGHDRVNFFPDEQPDTLR